MFHSVTLEQIKPDPGDPICVGDEIVFFCEVVGNQLIWTIEGPNGGNADFFPPSTNFGKEIDLGSSFTVILKNITSEGNSSVFTSIAKSTHGLTPTDIGKTIYCAEVPAIDDKIIVVSGLCNGRKYM